MTTPRYIRTEDGRVIQIPEAVSPTPIEAEPIEGEEVEEEAPKSKDLREDLSDITSISDEEKDWLFGTGGITDPGMGDEDLSDLVDVSNEDIMGKAPEPPKKKIRLAPKGKRAIRREPPPASLGGVQY